MRSLQGVEKNLRNNLQLLYLMETKYFDPRKWPYFCASNQMSLYNELILNMWLGLCYRASGWFTCPCLAFYITDLCFYDISYLIASNVKFNSILILVSVYGSFEFSFVNFYSASKLTLAKMHQKHQKSYDLLCHCVSVYHVSVDLFSRLDEMRKSIRQRDLFIDQ